MFVSNSPATSEAIHCSVLRTNTTGQVHLSSPVTLLEFGYLQQLYILIIAVDGDTNITLHSSMLNVEGMYLGTFLHERRVLDLLH